MAKSNVETMEVKEEVQQPVEDVWEAYVRNIGTILPTLMPGHFESTLEYVKGTPLTAGSVFVVKYHEDMPHYDTLTARWDEVDHANYRFKCTIVDGGALNKHFSHLSYRFSATPGSTSGSCVMHFVIDFVDIGDHSFHDFIKQELSTLCKAVESHLSK